MKEYYENRAKTYLIRRTPCIIRLDGKAFHSFTKNFQKPYDKVFHKAMNSTLQYLCKNIQGCKFGYTQSDEISLLLTDYDTLTTDAFFDYNVQKICSIAASMATLAFNKFFAEEVKAQAGFELYDKLLDIYCKAIEKGAMFDARCFNIPISEITNYFISRQQDATRNAIQMLGQTHFSSGQLHRKSTSDIQEMLWSEKNINFDNMPTEFKRGVCCYKRSVEKNGATRSEWFIDKEIPIFTQDRAYVEKRFDKEKLSNDGY
jgi:tRNA(His) 5'-end guanylyltransferase